MASKDVEVVVVVTGASAGVGRAVVRRFADESASIALIARAPERLDAAGGRALIVPLDVADCEAVEKAADEIEEKLGPIDVWVNKAMVTVFRHRGRDLARRVPPDDGSELPGLGVGDDGCTPPHAPAKPGHRRPDRIGAGLPGHPAPGGLLRRQARAAGVPRLAPRRAPARGQQGPCHDGSSSRAEHAPVFLGTDEAIQGASARPPIFQPEVAAEAVVWAARNPRRELWVGWSTVKAIVGNKIAPGLVDLYLARRGFDAQQAGDPVRPERRDNLFEPAPGDFAAHGRFEDHSKSRSAQLWATTHRRWLVGAATATAAMVWRAGIRSARRLCQAPADDGPDRATCSSARRRR
jgi:hypothetical protein